MISYDYIISNYIKTAQEHIKPTGVLVIGTFSEQSPTKCSGIGIKQYSKNSMTERLKSVFEKIKCITLDHKTPLIPFKILCFVVLKNSCL